MLRNVINPHIMHVKQKSEDYSYMTAESRRTPQQQRSRERVERILTVAKALISRVGSDAMKMGEVAAEAGISIGSLYQYFPDKVSIVEAVRHRHLEDCLSIMKSIAQKRQSLAKFVEELVTGMIGVHSIHPGLHKVLLDDAPSHQGTNDPNSAFEQEYLGLYAAAIAAHMTAGSKVESGTTALIVSDAIDGIIHNAARRGELQSPKVRREMIALVHAYLSQATGE